MTFGFKFAIIHGRVSILGVGFFFSFWVEIGLSLGLIFYCREISDLVLKIKKKLIGLLVVVKFR